MTDELAQYHVEAEATISTELVAQNNWEAVEQFEQAHGDFIEVEVDGMPLQIKIEDIEATFEQIVGDDDD